MVHKDQIVLGIQSACDVCGKEGAIVVCASKFGPVSFGYCKECFISKKEPYQAMVAYISCAGSWPEDINSAYQALVRHNLKLHGITEEQFKADCEKAFNPPLSELP